MQEKGFSWKHNVFFAFQWIIFNLVNIAVIPIVVGTALGLNPLEISHFTQRTMFFIGLASLLQILWGHKLPIIEGPAGMWWGIFITLAQMAPSMGKSLAVLRTDLELGMIVAGLFLVLFGATGLMGKALKLFTPPVTGTVLFLLTLQLSGVFLKGMTGMDETGVMDLKCIFLSTLVISLVIFLNVKGKGILKSLSVLIGTIFGWLLALLLGIQGHSLSSMSLKLVDYPKLFAWGIPTFDGGIVLISILTALLVLSNTVASMVAMEKTLHISLEKNIIIEELFLPVWQIYYQG